MNAIKILSRDELRNIKGGYIDPEFPGIRCVNSSGDAVQSACYSAGCAYGKSWCPAGTTCEDTTNC